MAGVFARLFGMSLTAGYLILAVVLVRLLLKQAPRNMICLLWGLVGIRLALPFSLKSAFSLVPGGTAADVIANLQVVSQDLLQASANPGGSGASAVDVVTGLTTAESWSQATASAAGSVPASIPQAISQPALFQPAELQSAILQPAALQLAAIVWLAGMAVLVAFSLITYGRLRRRVAPAVRLEGNIFQCDAIDSPFVLGFLSPRIYLPFSLEAACLGHVIAHETAHIRRRDHWIKPLGFLLVTVYWFNPLVWLAYILLCRDIELACDEKVIEAIGSGERKAYSASLLACSIRPGSIAVCPVAFGEVGVRQRVRKILNYRKPAFWLTLAAIIAGIAMAAGFLTDPISRSAVTVTAPIDQAVSAAILNYNTGKYAAGDCAGEGHQILLAENSQTASPNTLKVYVICSFSQFKLVNGSLDLTGGNAVIPTVMTFKAGPDGSYVLQEYLEVRDGSEMAPSIRRMFPQAIQEAALHVSEETRLDLNRQVEAYAVNYLRTLNRSAGNPVPSATAANPSGSAAASAPETGKLLADYPATVLPLYRSKELVSCAYNHDESNSSVIGQDYHLAVYRSSAPRAEVFDFYRALLTRVDDRHGDSRFDLSGWIGDWPVDIHLLIDSDSSVSVTLAIGWDRPRVDAKDLYFEPIARGRIDPPAGGALLGKYYEERFENERTRMLVVRYSTSLPKDEAMAYYRSKYQAADQFLEQHQGDGIEFIGWQDPAYAYKIFFSNLKGTDQREVRLILTAR